MILSSPCWIIINDPMPNRMISRAKEKALSEQWVANNLFIGWLNFAQVYTKDFIRPPRERFRRTGRYAGATRSAWHLPFFDCFAGRIAVRDKCHLLLAASLAARSHFSSSSTRYIFRTRLDEGPW